MHGQQNIKSLVRDVNCSYCLFSRHMYSTCVSASSYI